MEHFYAHEKKKYFSIHIKILTALNFKIAYFMKFFKIA